MPVGRITFKNSERNEFRIAFDSMAWALSMWDMDQWLRNRIKYHELSEEAEAELELARLELHMILDNRNLNLDMIE